MAKSPTVGIYTLGCKVNQYESEAIAEAFRSEGFSVLEPTERADLYIINTCTVTAESDRKARQFIRRAVGQNPDALVFVTGCFSQTSPESVAKIPGVDYVCGNADKLSVVRVAKEKLAAAEKAQKEPAPILAVPAPDAYGFEPMKIRSFGRTRAYVKIEDGCENHCAYCIIPSARGSVRSKPIPDVVEEVRTLSESGCREVVLTGIETASYGKDLPGADLPTLLSELDAIPGIGRVRLGSLDPSVATPAFVEKIKNLSCLAPHFHLSLQSGSSRTLAAMKRKYNADQARAAMTRLREAFPAVHFTTDVIVGFPGEDEAAFLETLEFLKEANFLHVHVFPYSRRRGTVADRMPNQVPEEEKHRRVARLSELQSEIGSALLQAEIGNLYPVLFETDTKGASLGHTPNFIEVFCPAKEPLHGEIRMVKIVGSDGKRAIGELLPDHF